MKSTIAAIGLALGATFAAQPALADRMPFEPYPNAEVTDSPRVINYDVIKLPAGPMGTEGPREVLELEGWIRWEAYLGPEGDTEVLIGRSYEAALADSGFDMLFSCVGDECGDVLGFLKGNTFRDGGQRAWNNWANYNDRSRLYLARRDSAESTEHFLLYISRYRNSSTQMRIGTVLVRTDPVESRAIDTGERDRAETRSAEELQQALVDSGSVEVPGIFFAFDSAELRPESRAALDEMAELMKSTDFRVLIAGHTDDQGTHEYNLDLSEQRAEAVRQALMENYSIDGGRMAARGFGFTEPVADNETEEGRQQNRRVEIIALP
jgi:OmpA-OmpF porin, OOP family